MKRLPGPRHSTPKAIGLSHLRRPGCRTFELGQQPVEASIRFACPTSCPSLRNGRFPASKLTAVLPHGGQFRTFDLAT